MRCRRAPRCATRPRGCPASDCADLADDQRLAGAQRLVGGALEFLRRSSRPRSAAGRRRSCLRRACSRAKSLRFEARLVAGGDDVAERQIASAARGSKNAKPRPPLCEITETWPRARSARGSSGTSLLSIAGLKVGQSAAAILAKPSRVRPAHRHVVALRDRADLAPACAGRPRPAPRQSRTRG